MAKKAYQSPKAELEKFTLPAENIFTASSGGLGDGNNEGNLDAVGDVEF